MNWLTAGNINKNEEKISDGTGLLLAPINLVASEKIEEPLQNENNINIEEKIEIEIDNKNPENQEEEIINENENVIINDNIENININENENENIEDLSSEIYELNETVKQLENSLEIKTEPELENLTQINNTVVEINLDDAANIKKAWQEKAANFDLSLDEPPPELWTQISESDDGEEESEIEYEQGVSLQGAAYVQKQRDHGKNFTERLHNSLKWRKQKAEKLKEEEDEKKDHHPYRSRSIIICSTMLMIMGFIFLALFFIQQLTPEKLNAKASSKFKSGNYEEAMNLYQRAYKRYPNVLTFLTGLAISAEKAGHLQTASTAWEAYMNALPKDDTINRRLARREMKRIQRLLSPEKPKEIKLETEEKKESQDFEAQQEKTEVKEEIKKPEVIIPVNFDDFLSEGNNAYNLGIYNTAIIYFSRAMELNGSDIRSYIGLARAYMSKGMYFDSKRIIDEAKRKFKRNSTIEVELQELKMK